MTCTHCGSDKIRYIGTSYKNFKAVHSYSCSNCKLPSRFDDYKEVVK